MTRRRARKDVSPEVSHRRAPAGDGVSIAYTLWRQPSAELVVLAPGFWRVRLARENLFLAHHFLRRGYDVAALDFRGHGDSDGRYAFGAAEHHDFEAVIGELVGPGRLYERFAVLGLSMGGSIAAHQRRGVCVEHSYTARPVRGRARRRGRRAIESPAGGAVSRSESDDGRGGT